MEEYYFVLCSDDYTPGQFARTVRPWHLCEKLYKPLVLEGKWEVGLVTCMLATPEPLPYMQLVRLPFCESIMMVGGKSLLPVVKLLTKADSDDAIWNFDPPTYVPVNQKFIDTLEVYITDLEGNPPFAHGNSSFVLHLRKVK